MIIELWRKIVATDYSIRCCAACGNDFDMGSVFPVAMCDDGYEVGVMCPVCLGYLSRRRNDAEDPTGGNWPATDWPSSQDLEEARRRYPKPMFGTEDELRAVATDRDVEARIYDDSVVWRMERERATP